MTPFLVAEFGKFTISNLIKECFGAEFQDLNAKFQVNYIYRYLSDLKALTVVLESDYVDKDYLEDFSKFYLRQFSSRGSKCARLHFFKDNWQHFHFEECLARGGPKSDIENLQNSYLGFVVIKPLPKTVIGKTCLKVYEKLMTEPRVILRRRYTVNLFGIELAVDSMAFQEQDKVTSACAATSIWCALHAIPGRSIREIPSCSEITTNAINFIAGSNNSFPSRELTNKQILRALDMEQLRHHSHALGRSSYLEAVELIRCYVGSNLPLILGVEVFEIQENQDLEKKAGHALTIVGFEFSSKGPCLYVHDDRLGPFARAEFILDEVILKKAEVNNLVPNWALALRRKDDQGSWLKPHELLVPETLFAMTDKKARLPVDLVINTCKLITKIYENGLSELELHSEKTQLDYDISLMGITDIKQRVLENCVTEDVLGITDVTNPKARARVAFLTQGFARFQWVAGFKLGGVSAFFVLFDATEIPQGHAVSAIYAEDPAGLEAVLAAIGSVEEDILVSTERNSFFASFWRRSRTRATTLHDHLSKLYGEPRAPRRLKAAEVVNNEMVNNASRKAYYEATDHSLEDLYPELASADDDSMIWVIDHEGTLVIGKEDDNAGHPTLTGFKPARIAGELKKDKEGWYINSKSGRYSGNYSNVDELLENALARFKSTFYMSRGHIRSSRRPQND